MFCTHRCFFVTCDAIIVNTVNGTEWHLCCRCAVNKLLTHSQHMTMTSERLSIHQKIRLEIHGIVNSMKSHLQSLHGCTMLCVAKEMHVQLLGAG